MNLRRKSEEYWQGDEFAKKMNLVDDLMDLSALPTTKQVFPPREVNENASAAKGPTHEQIKHGIVISVPALVSVCVVGEAVLLFLLLLYVYYQVRKKQKRDVESGTKKGADVNETYTSTPYQHRSVYPGLSSALSETLNFTIPVMSPIDVSDRPKMHSFSGIPAIPTIMKPDHIQSSSAPERPRSHTLHNLGAETKRALFAMTRSKSTPERLHAASVSVSSEVETSMGRIDPNIYKREELEAKFVGDVARRIEKESRLCFTVNYDREIELLKVCVVQATNLPAIVKEGVGDIFVKISLDPDHQRRSMSSSIHHGNRSPVFRQNFVFKIAKGAASGMTVKFTVCEYDRYSHPAPLGQVQYSLVDHTFREDGADELIWLKLEKPEVQVTETNVGEILVSLTYLPNAERVNLIIMKAKNLRLPEWGEMKVGRSILDTFVKITVMRCGKVMKHKHTGVIRRSCSPVYNEAFSIDRMRLSEMSECCFVISVCVRLNQFRMHRVIGKCVVGGKDCATGDGLSHWNEMADSPRSIVARWHQIQ